MQAEFHIPFMNILERVALRGFFYLGFLSDTLDSHNSRQMTGYFFNSFLPLSHASQTLST